MGRLRRDPGSEFICEALSRWLPARGAAANPVAAGSPWESGDIASFRSRFRDGFVEAELFEPVPGAKGEGEWLRREYNAVRPHGAPGDKAPKEVSGECGQGLHGRPPKGKG